MQPASPWRLPVATAVLLALLALAYWPGLSGPFMFDDYGNLDVLGAYGRIVDVKRLLFFVTSGNADPTGRPVALLTFLLDARHWPADPFPFKRTNLLLHLLDTALLASVVAALQKALQRRRPDIAVSRWAPLAAAMLWGAHPFFVSTTLYVIQREAMLPMTFVLLAMLAWRSAIAAFEGQRHSAGWLWAIVGFGGMTMLAGLSKANGLLAPLLVGLAYVWFLQPTDAMARRQGDRAALLCLGIPSLLLLAYLGMLAWNLWPLAQLPARDWTLPQRLLSEPRALWSYLAKLALPRAGGGGLFVEDFQASRDWWQPATTTWAVLGLAVTTLVAVAGRRRFPIASFAWLFFLLAHLMESSVVPLELYFEHRNYLAASMLGWPIAHLLLQPGAYRRYGVALLGLLVAALLLLTHERATAWGNPQLFGELSATHRSSSARAQVEAASQEIEHGRVAAGLARLHALQRDQPESLEVAITTIGAECVATGRLVPATLDQARQVLSSAKSWNYGLYDWMQGAANDPAMRACRGFGLEGLDLMLDSADANPANRAPLRQRDLKHVRGVVALAGADPDTALHWFNEAVAMKPDPEYALVQAAALGNAGWPASGVSHLDAYRRIEAAQPPEKLGGMPGVHRWLLYRYGFYAKQIDSLRAQLQADAMRPSARPANPSPHRPN